MRADPSLDANQNRNCDVHHGAINRCERHWPRGDDLYSRGRHGQGRIFTPCFRVREARGGFVYPGLRTALLNTAAQYRNRANQTVVSRADAKFLSNEHPRGPRGAIRVSRLSLRTFTPLPCAATDRFRQIDAARKSQMAALATINPHKTTMARLLFIDGLRIGKDALMSKPRRVCREGEVRGEVSRSQLNNFRCQ